MRDHDNAKERIRAGVSCTMVLEALGPGWTLDPRESTRRCRKYRRGPGRILIVSHEGRGWWDPLSAAKGDVFDLVRHLDPGLGFGQACDVLGAFVGLNPSGPAPGQARRWVDATPDVAGRWGARPPVAEGAPAWRYLTGERGLPGAVVAHAVQLGTLREGPRGSAWFAHRDGEGCLTGIEMRGPAWRGFSAGGQKSLFRLRGDGGQAATRLAIAEAAIDALSLAALEGLRPGTLYAATAGGMGPLTLACMEAELRCLAARPGTVLAAATDADAAGERLAGCLAELAHAAGVPCERLRPPGGHKDWNDCLRGQAAEGR